MTRLLSTILGALLAASLPLGALAQGGGSGGGGAAQGFPSKPVRLVVPFAAGGPADVLGRAVGDGLSKRWGQPVVVENKAGAAGTIGVDQVAKAAPDGHTLAVVPVGNIAVNPSLMPNLPYKAADLVPIAMLATAENVLVVHPGVQARSLGDLLKLARQQPGKLTFASPGAGSQAHLAGELLQLDANVKLIHVPYKGVSPAMTDLVGGQVTMMFAQMSAALPYIQAGRLRALGVASGKRSAVLPDVPTIAEQGFPQFEAVSWYALMAPAGTPPQVVEQLNRLTGEVLADPGLKSKLATLGMDVGGGTPRQLAETIQKETARWAAVIKQRGISVE
ncbi:tripartite tricarboxylate transporter substrate binding protein [Cupriavidus gilardii]|uniref:tripartite tricarboxylate transporter substrate binding protein n=1 Tax=Cupriavidus gilardii TaxID=82541 RepID=UPI001EE5A31E|nr:tripartite tricarboxylate transporter substrate binding protein [Cupriavidus gilardii]MCG5260555.1 tripartite tricarboxylate transporter substrate binding protein [Cupriavidus gilardii]MDF9428402.1 tripartite tricarboxylate transporter substrate binding protein [Cupriavidus gilardii]